MRPLRLALLLLLLVSAASARAEAPEGEYTLSVTGSDGLFVPSGGSELCLTSRGFDICMTARAQTNALGGVSGFEGEKGLVTIEGDALQGNLPLVVAGSVAGTNQRPTAALVFEFVGGTVTENGQPLDARGSGRMRCKLDPTVADSMACRGSAVACGFSESEELLGCTRFPVVTRLALERVSFGLVLDLTTSEDGVVTGAAEVVLSPTNSLPRHVTGHYDARSDTATLLLTGFDSNIGKIALKRVTFAQGTFGGGRVVYKIAGQKGAITLP